MIIKNYDQISVALVTHSVTDVFNKSEINTLVKLINFILFIFLCPLQTQLMTIPVKMVVLCIQLDLLVIN